MAETGRYSLILKATNSSPTPIIPLKQLLGFHSIGQTFETQEANRNISFTRPPSIIKYVDIYSFKED